MPTPARCLFLRAIALGITLTLIQVSIKPTSPVPLSTEIPLPQTISLPGWQTQPSQPIAPRSSASRYNRVLAGQRYFYRQGDRSLQVTVHPVVETEGDVGQFMIGSHSQSISPPISFEDRQSSNGFYRIFTQQNQAYLQSCLNLNGYATVTSTQFRQNAYVQALQPQQWLGWLMSQRRLLERRCLWIQISTPIEQRDVQLAYAALEQSWKTLIPIWRSYLP
jgi:cyanosortase A-associated protein